MSSLPRPFTALIGREHDVATIAELLEPFSGSVLTLVGPAGVGKTRLAIAVANAVADRFVDGVAYIDLAAVTDPDQVLPMLVSALGIPDGEGAPSRLARFLDDRSLLLVVDNFEQVRDAAPALNACLAAARDVRTIITSQAPLRVRGEREYSVEPLPFPDAQLRGPISADELRAIEGSPAVELFVRRAHMVRPSFALTTGNAAAVAAICRQLDGLPLAIELAAARSNILSPEALLSRLSTPLQFLRSGPRDVPQRHQALHAALSWSVGLLPSDEALLLERLSIFAGGFSLAAAEAVAGCDPIEFEPSFYAEPPDLPPNEPRLETGRIFDLLDALVDHSLVQQVESDDEPRFRLFTTIRQFGRERLQARGTEDQIALRHASWYRSKAEATWTAAGPSAPESEWLGALERDVDNFRAAIAWLTETDPAAASTFVAALGWLFYFYGRRNEGIGAFERTDGRFDPAVLSPVNRARNHYIRGILLAHCPGREREGGSHFEAMLAEVEALDIDWAVGFALVALGVTAEDAGEYERALELFHRARPILEAQGGIANTANVDFHMASALLGLSRTSEARALVEPIVALDPADAGVNLVYALHLIGVICIVEGDLPGAARSTRRFIDTALSAHMGRVSTEATDATATIAVRSGDFELGARLFGTADRVNSDADYAIQFPERPVYLAAREAAREALGQDRFDELYCAGRQIGFEAAVALVREALDSYAGGGEAHGTQDVEARLLTPRELEVLQLVAAGMTDREIGERLFISHATARTHVGNILEKLRVPSRSAATSLALRAGLVRLEDAPQ
jgi:predicted ATPase/DNA-binding CsgD family transcriptional regulator